MMNSTFSLGKAILVPAALLVLPGFLSLGSVVEPDAPAADPAFLSDDIREALIEATRGFLEEPEATAKSAWIAYPDDNMKSFVQWYDELGDVDWSEAETSSRLIRNPPFTLLGVEGPGLPSSRIMLVDTESGPRVDWKAFAIYQEAPWQTLGESIWEDGVEIRAEVEPVPNHHSEFSAREGYRCFILVHPRTRERLFAYARWETDEPLPPVLANLERGIPQSMTLRVRQPSASAGTREVLVLEWIALGWSQYRGLN